MNFVSNICPFCSINIFIIDKKLFDVLKKEFDKCIIISHLDKIKNMNNTVLRVKRDEKGYSKII